MKNKSLSFFNSLWFKFWLVLVLSIPIILLSVISSATFPLAKIQFKGEFNLMLILSSIVYIVIIFTFIKESFQEFKSGLPGIASVIIISSTLLAINVFHYLKTTQGSPLFFDFAFMIDLLFLNYLLIRSTLNPIFNVNIFQNKIPARANLKIRDELKNISSETIQEGDEIVVDSKERIPCDGIVIDGIAKIDDLFKIDKITREKGPQSHVTAGSFCIEGKITIQTTGAWKNTFLNKISEILNTVMKNRSTRQIKIEKIATILFYFSAMAAVVQFILSYFLLKDGFSISMQKAVSFMVITSSYVLLITVPLCVFMSVSRLASKGIIITNREAFEQALRLDVVVFDRTGTLTEARFGVIDIVVFNQRFTKGEILKFAASVEKNYQNPIAKAIIEFSEEVLPASKFEVIDNQGVYGVVENKNIKVVNVNHLVDNNIRYDSRRHNEFREGGKTVVYVVIENEVYGAIILTDVIRAESRELIKNLKKRAVKAMLLTSDTKDAARWMANELQLDNYFAEVTKKNAPNKIKDLQSQGHRVGVTGSIKDQDLLKQADVGFAIGTGTHTNMTADILHYYRNPIEIIKVLKMSQLTNKKINQNVLWIIIYTIITSIIVSGFVSEWAIVITPAIAGVLTLLGTLVVILNSRLYHYVK